MVQMNRPRGHELILATVDVDAFLDAMTEIVMDYNWDMYGSYEEQKMEIVTLIMELFDK